MQRYVWTRSLIAFALLSGLIGVAQLKPMGNSKKTLQSGSWGGEHARMEVTATGATLEFGCANGEILEPLSLDYQDHFRVKGNFQAQGPGPSQELDENNPNALYSGVVKGDTVQLEIQVKGEEQSHTYTLTRGRKSKLLNCK
jgi:hypothetical protein